MDVQGVFTEELQIGILTAIRTTTTGFLDAAELRLYTNDADVLPTSVTGDFTTADYTGYADEAVTWSAVTRSDAGDLEIIGTAGEFRPSDAVTPNAVYGWLLLTAGGDLVCGSRFPDGPLPMESALDAILLTARIRATPSGLVALVS